MALLIAGGHSGLPRRGEGGSKQMGCAKGGIRGVQGVTFRGQLENEGSNNSLKYRCGQNKTFGYGSLRPMWWGRLCQAN